MTRDGLPIGQSRPETQAAELRYWEGHGLSEWSLHLQFYERVFSFGAIDFSTWNILDVGSGPISVFEKMAPPRARIVPYDTLAADYNRIASEKNFRIHDRVPADRFRLITMFNCLDHMDAPAELLKYLTGFLAGDGEIWIYCHLDRPFSPIEHPQKFRFWQLVSLVDRYFPLIASGVIREGRLFPYAWWGVGVGTSRNSTTSTLLRQARWSTRCAISYGRFHSERAIIKGIKVIGLRRLLPKPLQF